MAASGPLFVADVQPDSLWETYLSSFPAGSNPIFRQRTEHDCSCCRHFVKSLGNVVAIRGSELETIWDVEGLPAHYQAVADALSSRVRGSKIADIFLTPEAKCGAVVSHERTESGVLTWGHFNATVPDSHVSRDGAEKRGFARSSFDVLKRGIEELLPDAVETVAELIAENALYRGTEHRATLLEFQKLQRKVLRLNDPRARDLAIWQAVDSTGVARFRNTAIGTLVQDLSEGKGLEAAVKSYESKVAPDNYKRPTALVTKSMVESAMKTIEELGLEPALHRRHARLEDVSVSSVLFVDNSVRERLRGGVRDLLMGSVKTKPVDPKSAEPISADEFVERVLPKCTSVSLHLDNGLLGNFVSLTAPAEEGSAHLFKWDNDFAWSYDGNVADSIKDRVKRAGGQVEGVALRISLAWRNTDDLDLHVVEPGGNHIYFGNKCGKLDVDMNAWTPLVRDAVENIRWRTKPAGGSYRVYVNNYRRRESIDPGFEVEIESPSGLERISFSGALAGGANQPVAKLTVRRGAVEVTPERGVVAGSIAQEKWGLKTLETARVNSIIVSPNYWDGNAVGNKHLFFVLDGCRNPDATRGIYNEFLSPKLEKHRKVFEVLGDKTKCPPTEEQMSGVGFSSTRHDKVTVTASGPDFTRAYTINF